MHPLLPTRHDGPTAAGERLELIDALRGFALAGVLLVNLDSFSLYAFLDGVARAALPTAGFDLRVDAIKSLLVDEKAVTVFSMLFGLGFALQLERAEARGSMGLKLYARRMGVLLLFGLVHSYLFWWGDILLVYALMGFLLVLCRRLSQRALLASGFFVALVLPAVASPWIDPLLKGMPSQGAMEAANLAAFSSPNWLVAWAQNVVFSNWAYTVWWTIWPFVFGRFLLGFWAGRTGLLQQPEKHRHLLLGIFKAAAIIGTAATALEYFEQPLSAAFSTTAGTWGSIALALVMRAGPLGLGIAYAAGFALLFLHEPARRYLRLLAPVGRMALTNYLAQTAVCLALFYGAGLGIGPKYGVLGILSAWIALFGAQVFFSRWWLSRYRFGPVEWLWRSLTYANRQPMSVLRAVR
ncbi:MAG: DUF418 domain-containing protein [Pseudoxanthomonas sp.]